MINKEGILRFSVGFASKPPKILKGDCQNCRYDIYPNVGDGETHTLFITVCNKCKEKTLGDLKRYETGG